jgi:hypothetical protein
MSTLNFSRDKALVDVNHGLSNLAISGNIANRVRGSGIVDRFSRESSRVRN